MYHMKFMHKFHMSFVFYFYILRLMSRIWTSSSTEGFKFESEPFKIKIHMRASIFNTGWIGDNCTMLLQVLGVAMSATSLARLNTTLYVIFSVTNSNRLAQILVVNCSIVWPTLNVNPTSFVVPCNFWGYYRFIALHLLPLTKWFFIHISITHDNISSQVADKEKLGFWPTDELIRQSWQYFFLSS